jgi:hypothetical protein
MSIAFRGTTYRDRRVKSPGICELLGLKPFTPLDLRRTAATMCGELGLSEAGIALCLDHQANKDENGKPLPAVTPKVYKRSPLVHVAKKREVLDAWAKELRRIRRRGRTVPCGVISRGHPIISNGTHASHLPCRR